MGWSPGGSPSRKIENRNGKMGKAVLSLLLWSWTGTVYFFLEIIWKTAHSRPESISWTMLALAIVLAVPLERFGAELPWECPLWAQGLICGTGITAVEFVSGLVLNVWFKMGSGITPASGGTCWGRSVRNSGRCGAHFPFQPSCFLTGCVTS